jgi:hypothetical protein
MPCAFWKRQAFSVRGTEKSWESSGSDAAWRAQKELSGSMTEEQHWRPVAVRYWHRSGVKSELGDLCVILILDVEGGVYPPPVFWKKSLQSIENKRREFGKERQESSRGGKILQGKEIEEAKEVKEFGRGVLLGRAADGTTLRRVFTSDDMTDYLSCQYIK